MFIALISGGNRWRSGKGERRGEGREGEGGNGDAFNLNHQSRCRQCEDRALEIGSPSLELGRVRRKEGTRGRGVGGEAKRCNGSIASPLAAGAMRPLTGEMCSL